MSENDATDSFYSRNSNSKSNRNGHVGRNQKPGTVRREAELVAQLEPTVMSLAERDEERPFVEDHGDGTRIKNMNNAQLKLILEFMEVCHDQQVTTADQDETALQPIFDKINFPVGLIHLVQLFALSVTLGLPILQRYLLNKICSNVHFLQYTNVRRYILQCLRRVDRRLISIVLAKLPAEILIFVLTDPCLEACLPEPEHMKPILLGHYKAFTREMEAYQPETLDGLLEKMILPRMYQPVYEDTSEELKCGDAVVERVNCLVQQLREIFAASSAHFDFHNCFHHAKYMELEQESRGQFEPHQEYAQAEDFQSGDKPPVLEFPLILLTTIKADAFVGCFCEIFQHSQKFANIQRLDLRGCDEQTVSRQRLVRILRACHQITQLDLSFMKQQVDQEVLLIIGDQYSLTLEVLELRACSRIDDGALLGLVRRLADPSANKTQRRPQASPSTTEQDKVKIKYLNLACLPLIKDEAVEAIRDHLLGGLQALSLWGCQNISSDGLVSLQAAAIQAHRQAQQPMTGPLVVAVTEQ